MGKDTMKILTVDKTKCNGCGACQVLCSAVKKNKVQPSESRIRIRRSGDPDVQNVSVCQHILDAPIRRRRLSPRTERFRRFWANKKFFVQSGQDNKRTPRCGLLFIWRTAGAFCELCYKSKFFIAFCLTLLVNGSRIRKGAQPAQFLPKRKRGE